MVFSSFLLALSLFRGAADQDRAATACGDIQTPSYHIKLSVYHLISKNYGKSL